MTIASEIPICFQKNHDRIEPIENWFRVYPCPVRLLWEYVVAH